MNKHITSAFFALALLPSASVHAIGEERLQTAKVLLEKKADRIATMREKLRTYKNRVDERVMELKALQSNVDATDSLVAQYRLEAGEVSKEVRRHLDIAKDAVNSDALDKDLTRSIDELDHLSEQLGGIVGPVLDVVLVPTKGKTSAQLNEMIAPLDKNGTIDNILADTLRVVVSIRGKIKASPAPAESSPEKRSASTPPRKGPPPRRVIPARRAVTPKPGQKKKL